MKLFCQNFGCKLNLAELQEIKISALNLGYKLTNQISVADLILINTCNVTAKAFHKISQNIKKYSQLKKPIIVTGCLPPSFLKQKQPANIIIVPASKKKTIPDLLQKINQKNSNLINNSYSYTQLAKTRSFIKIQTGCNTRCTYCVIPYQRGQSVSFSPAEIVASVNFYLEQNYQEIVLTGTNLGQYHYQKIDLADLLKIIVTQTKVKRLRISSIDVCDINNHLLDLYKQYSSIICPHFHLALQSGSDKILKLMARPYTSSQYLAVVEKIYSRLPQATITTDVIVGFPGEDDQDLKQTIKVMEKANFLKTHLFSYSDHEQTPASGFHDHVKSQTIKSRYKKLAAIAKNTRTNFLESQIGQIFPVLIEQIRPKDIGKNIYRGYSHNYLPICISSFQPLITNKVYSVKVINIVKDWLQGNIDNNRPVNKY